MLGGHACMLGRCGVCKLRRKGACTPAGRLRSVQGKTLGLYTHPALLLHRRHPAPVHPVEGPGQGLQQAAAAELVATACCVRVAGVGRLLVASCLSGVWVAGISGLLLGTRCHC